MRLGLEAAFPRAREERQLDLLAEHMFERFVASVGVWEWEPLTSTRLSLPGDSISPVPSVLAQLGAGRMLYTLIHVSGAPRWIPPHRPHR